MSRRTTCVPCKFQRTGDLVSEKNLLNLKKKCPNYFEHFLFNRKNLIPDFCKRLQREYQMHRSKWNAHDDFFLAAFLDGNTLKLFFALYGSLPPSLSPMVRTSVKLFILLPVIQRCFWLLSNRLLNIVNNNELVVLWIFLTLKGRWIPYDVNIDCTGLLQQIYMKKSLFCIGTGTIMSSPDSFCATISFSQCGKSDVFEPTSHGSQTHSRKSTG